MKVWTVVVAAGTGDRFGSPKQFAMLAGASVVDRSIETALATTDGVVVVLPADATWHAPARVLTAQGGATRSASVRAGLARVPAEAACIVVHDAARPLASRALFGVVIDAIARGADAAVPVLPVVDTVKRVSGEHVVETIAREGLFVVQTPQAFRASALRAAHETGSDASDDAALVEKAGGVVVTVEGERRNLKLTHADDLDMARALVAEARA